MFVSIIIPVRNSAEYISECLRQVVRQDYPRELLEVFIADGASTDGTPDVAQSFDLKGVRKVVLRLSVSGRSQGLNAAIRLAHGDAICRLDVRSRIPDNYISTCASVMESTGADNVGGVQVPLGSAPVQRAIGLAMSHRFGVGNAPFRIAKHSGYVDTLYLGFFRREVFTKVGYFDEASSVISEDSDLNQRIRAAGGRVYLNAGLKVGYEPRASLADQAVLYYRYGGARAANILKHGRPTSVRQIIPGGFFAFILTLAVAGLWKSVLLGVAAGILVAYATVTIVVASWISLTHKTLSVLLPLAATFPVMHISFAYGFWRRLLLGGGRKVHWAG